MLKRIFIRYISIYCCQEESKKSSPDVRIGRSLLQIKSSGNNVTKMCELGCLIQLPVDAVHAIALVGVSFGVILLMS